MVSPHSLASIFGISQFNNEILYVRSIIVIETTQRAPK